MVFDAPTPPDYRPPDNKELVVPQYTTKNDETTLDLLAFLASEQANLDNQDNDTPTPDRDPENPLSSESIQKIQ